MEERTSENVIALIMWILLALYNTWIFRENGSQNCESKLITQMEAIEEKLVKEETKPT